MTRNLDTVEPSTDIAEAAEHMARLKIRHLPVVEGGSLVGIISIRDLINWAVDELTTGHELPDMERSHTALTAAVEINRAQPAP
jgi:CBS domain-containing protein